MNRKHSLAILSTSGLAAGIARGAVIYSGPLDIELPCPDGATVLPAEIDMNGDGVLDFTVGFDGASSSNWRKPFINALISETSTPLTQPDGGAPVTPFGTLIDASYLEPSATKKAYLSQNGDGNVVGDWPQTSTTDAYVGVELFDVSNSTTNYGWVRVIYSPTANPPSLTLVDWALETAAGVGIPAGSTNTLGAPQIYAGPESQTVPTGATAEFRVRALGQPAPEYQWQAGAAGSGVYTNLTDAGNVSGAKTASLKIDGAATANGADYIVVVSNALGSSTSSPPARLTVVPPVISPPVQSLFAGLQAHFNVSIGGGLSPAYQWRKGGVNLSDGGRVSGATTAQLTISGLAAEDAGDYDVLLTLGASTVASAASALTVLPFKSLYESVLLSAEPVAYYRLGETGSTAGGSLIAYDNAGAFNGHYGAEVTTGVAGPRSADGFPGFAATNNATRFTPDLPGSRVDVAPWHLNTDTLTLTAWLNPAGEQKGSAGVIYTLSSNNAVAGLHYYYQPNAETSRTSIGYNWRNEMDFFWDPAISPPDNQWSFVALVIQPTTASIHIFNTNGLTSATNDGAWWTNAVPPRAPIPFDVPQQIGTDPTSTSGGQNFNGAIDEVAVFRKALTLDQLQSIYDAARGLGPVTLQATRVGDSVRLTWERGQLLEAEALSGQWTTNATAVSPYTTPATGNQKFYRVLVR